GESMAFDGAHGTFVRAFRPAVLRRSGNACTGARAWRRRRAPRAARRLAFATPTDHRRRALWHMRCTGFASGGEPMSRTRFGARSRSTSTLMVSLLVAIAIPTYATATTIVVPIDQPTIAAAVSAATAGDVVIVQAGTYAESIRIDGARDGLTIAGADE